MCLRSCKGRVIEQLGPVSLILNSSKPCSSSRCSHLGLPNLFSFRVLFNIGITFFTDAIFLNPVLSTASKYEACKPRNCVNGPNISYHFFIRGAGADFCGYLGFQIHCKEDKPIYKTSKRYFSIQDISYENQSFRSVDEGLFNDSCVAPVQNFSFDRSSLDFSLYHADLYFFNSCNDSFYVNHTKSKVTCASNATHGTFVVLAPGDEGLNWSTIACESLVASPVQLETEEINRTIESFNHVKLLKGWICTEMDWTQLLSAEEVVANVDLKR